MNESRRSTTQTNLVWCWFWYVLACGLKGVTRDNSTQTNQRVGETCWHWQWLINSIHHSTMGEYLKYRRFQIIDLWPFSQNQLTVSTLQCHHNWYSHYVKKSDSKSIDIDCICRCSVNKRRSQWQPMGLSERPTPAAARTTPGTHVSHFYGGIILCLFVQTH